jgi:catechol 2,3-dioxygenase-like lactoylglutathione lyase family enzyme
MQQNDIAIPTLPCKSVKDTLLFFQRLGFEGKLWGEPPAYAILTRGPVELHFFAHKELQPAQSHAGCYIRVSDVESICRAFASAGLPATGIPRQDPLAVKPWGMKEFAIVDPDGNLLRIGQPL